MRGRPSPSSSLWTAPWTPARAPTTPSTTCTSSPTEPGRRGNSGGATMTGRTQAWTQQATPLVSAWRAARVGPLSIACCARLGQHQNPAPCRLRTAPACSSTSQGRATPSRGGQVACPHAPPPLVQHLSIMSCAWMRHHVLCLDAAWAARKARHHLTRLLGCRGRCQGSAVPGIEAGAAAGAGPRHLGGPCGHQGLGGLPAHQQGLPGQAAPPGPWGQVGTLRARAQRQVAAQGRL